jgi:hypothetical protein
VLEPSGSPARRAIGWTVTPASRLVVRLRVPPNPVIERVPRLPPNYVAVDAIAHPSHSPYDGEGGGVLNLPTTTINFALLASWIFPIP